jgi:microcystin-dependent protein
MVDRYVGEIRMTASPLVPEGWALCNGQTLQVNQYQLLFALIGTVYGGDGVNTFNLPDMRGRVPVSNGTSKTGINYPLGQTGGAETVTLTGPNLAVHTHAVKVQSALGSLGAPTDAVWAGTTVAQFDKPGTLVSMNAGTVSATGGNAQGGVSPHENMMPFQTLSFIIALTGLFPDFD